MESFLWDGESNKMTPTLSLSISSHSLPMSKETQLHKSTNKESPCPKIPKHDTKLIPRRNLLTSTGLGLIAGPGLKPNTANAEVAPPSPSELASSRMSYSRFLTYLNEEAVKKVDLVENGQSAIVEICNPALDKIQRVKVQLPGLPPELVRKMKEKNVDFAANPPEINMGGAILELLSNLAFPLILLGTLLLRSSRGNIPGGPNLPFGLGGMERGIAPGSNDRGVTHPGERSWLGVDTQVPIPGEPGSILGGGVCKNIYSLIEEGHRDGGLLC